MSGSTTDAILNGLANQYSQDFNNVAALPIGDPNRVFAVDQVSAANQAYQTAVKTTANNGGTLPGATDSIPTQIITPGTARGGGRGSVHSPPTPSIPATIQQAVSALPSNVQNAVAAVTAPVNAVLNPAGLAPANSGGASSAAVTVPDRRVRLTPKNMEILKSGSLLSPLLDTQGLMFPFTPQIDYIGTVNYGTQSVAHSNQDYRFYTNTASTTVTIMGTFTAQTQDEAKYMLACLHFLRTVTKMRFGSGSAIGLPPPVLVLNGYGNGIFYNLPVIITNFTVGMPNNVDYVQTKTGSTDAWLPVYTTITVTCVVQNTPNKMRSFNWDAFASGYLLKSGGWS